MVIYGDLGIVNSNNEKKHMDLSGGTSTHGRSYKRFDPDLLRRYTTVAWFKYNLSFSGMDQKYRPYPLEIYGSGLWIARG